MWIWQHLLWDVDDWTRLEFVANMMTSSLRCTWHEFLLRSLLIKHKSSLNSMLLCTLSIPTYSGDNSIIETKFSTKTTRLLLPIKYDTLSTTNIVNEYNNNEYVDTPLIINTNATTNAVNKSLTLFDTNTANEYVISKATSSTIEYPISMSTISTAKYSNSLSTIC